MRNSGLVDLMQMIIELGRLRCPSALITVRWRRWGERPSCLAHRLQPPAADLAIDYVPDD